MKHYMKHYMKSGGDHYEIQKSNLDYGDCCISFIFPDRLLGIRKK